MQPSIKKIKLKNHLSDEQIAAKITHSLIFFTVCIMELLNSRKKEASQRLHLQALVQNFYSKHFISLRSFLSHLHFTETSVWKHLLHSETGLFCWVEMPPLSSMYSLASGSCLHHPIKASSHMFFPLFI